MFFSIQNKNQLINNDFKTYGDFLNPDILNIISNNKVSYLWELRIIYILMYFFFSIGIFGILSLIINFISITIISININNNLFVKKLSNQINSLIIHIFLYLVFLVIGIIIFFVKSFKQTKYIEQIKDFYIKDFLINLNYVEKSHLQQIGYDFLSEVLNLYYNKILDYEILKINMFTLVFGWIVLLYLFPLIDILFIYLILLHKTSDYNKLKQVMLDNSIDSKLLLNYNFIKLLDLLNILNKFDIQLNDFTGIQQHGKKLNNLFNLINPQNIIRYLFIKLVDSNSSDDIFIENYLNSVITLINTLKDIINNDINIDFIRSEVKINEIFSKLEHHTIQSLSLQNKTMNKDMLISINNYSYNNKSLHSENFFFIDNNKIKCNDKNQQIIQSIIDNTNKLHKDFLTNIKNNSQFNVFFKVSKEILSTSSNLSNKDIDHGLKLIQNNDFNIQNIEILNLFKENDFYIGIEHGFFQYLFYHISKRYDNQISLDYIQWLLLCILCSISIIAYIQFSVNNEKLLNEILSKKLYYNNEKNLDNINKTSILNNYIIYYIYFFLIIIPIFLYVFLYNHCKFYFNSTIESIDISNQYNNYEFHDKFNNKKDKNINDILDTNFLKAYFTFKFKLLNENSHDKKIENEFNSNIDKFFNLDFFSEEVKTTLNEYTIIVDGEKKLKIVKNYNCKTNDIWKNNFSTLLDYYAENYNNENFGSILNDMFLKSFHVYNFSELELILDIIRTFLFSSMANVSTTEKLKVRFDHVLNQQLKFLDNRGINHDSFALYCISNGITFGDFMRNISSFMESGLMLNRLEFYIQSNINFLIWQYKFCLINEDQLLENVKKLEELLFDYITCNNNELLNKSDINSKIYFESLSRNIDNGITDKIKSYAVNTSKQSFFSNVYGIYNIQNRFALYCNFIDNERLKYPYCGVTQNYKIDQNNKIFVQLKENSTDIFPIKYEYLSETKNIRSANGGVVFFLLKQNIDGTKTWYNDDTKYIINTLKLWLNVLQNSINSNITRFKLFQHGFNIFSTEEDVFHGTIESSIVDGLVNNKFGVFLQLLLCTMIVLLGANGVYILPISNDIYYGFLNRNQAIFLKQYMEQLLIVKRNTKNIFQNEFITGFMFKNTNMSYQINNFDVFAKNNIISFNKSTLFTTVVVNMTFDIIPGLKVGLIGTSGGGKSTLLNTIDGDKFHQKNNTVKVILSNITKHFIIKDIEELPSDFLRKNVITVKQSIVFDKFLIKDVIDLVLPNPIDQMILKDLLNEVSMGFIFDEDVMNRYFFTLSGGQQRRIVFMFNFVKMITKYLKCLIVDEFIGLDIKNRHIIYTILTNLHYWKNKYYLLLMSNGNEYINKSINNYGTELFNIIEMLPNTVIVVSHTPYEIAKLVDRIVFFNSGRTSILETEKSRKQQSVFEYLMNQQKEEVSN